MGDNCPNINDPSFIEIKDATFEAMAYHIWDLNNGNPIDKTSVGEDSILFKNLLDKLGDRDKAIAVKSNMYISDVYFSKEDVDTNGEPNIEQFERFIPQKDTQMGLQEPKVNLSQKFKNRPLLTPTNKAVSNEVVFQTNKVYHYGEDMPKGSNKRHVANKFFRYSRIRKNIRESSVPTYPFRVSEKNWQINKDYIDYINKHYDKEVVGVDNYGVIEYRPDIENAKYTNTDDVWGAAEELNIEDLIPVIAQSEISKESKITEKILVRLNKRLELMQKRTSKTGGSPQLKAKITALESQITKLEKIIEKNELLFTIEEMAIQDSNFIKENLQNIRENIDNIKDLSPEEILSLTGSLIDNSYGIKGWIDIQSLIGNTNPKLKEELRTIQGDYIDLNMEYNDLLAELFTEYGNRFSRRNDFAKNDIVKAVKDIGLVQSGVFSIGDSGIELLEIVDDVIKKATDNIRQETISKEKELNRWEKRLLKAGYAKDDINKLFKQLDSKGKWTGNIIGEISHGYYIEKEEKYIESIKERNNNIYFRWLKENSNMLNFRHLKEISNKNYKNAEKLGYSKEELDLQKELLDKFDEERSAYTELLESKYRGDKGDKLIQEDLYYWERANSPYLFVQGETNNGSAYLIKERAHTKKWGDKRFDKIKNDVDLNEFYEFLRKRLDENNKNIGFFNEFDENYLPEQQNGFLEQIKTQKGLWKKTAFALNSSKKLFVEELENLDDDNHNLDGIPIRMMQNNIPPAMKDGDIFRAVSSHTEMSLNYKYKSEIEPITNAATDLLEELKDIDESDKIGRKEPLINAKRALQYRIDADLLGKRKKTEGRLKKVKIDKYKEDPETGEIISEKKDVEVTVSALGDSLISYTYLKAMSIPNIVTPAVNMLFGINSNLIYASAGGDVTLSNIRKSMIQMTSVTTRSFGGETNNELANKVYEFMAKFGLLGVIHDSQYGKKKSNSEMITILQSKAEHFNQGSLMLGILYTQKLKDKNGKEISVFDAYTIKNGELVWDVSKMGEEKIVPNNRILSEDKRNVNFNKLGRYIDKVNATVHGDYKSVMMAKKSIALRILMLFKTWLPAALNHRFGAEDFDKDLMSADGGLGRTVKGRYRSFYKPETKDGHTLLFRETIGLMLKGIVSKKAFNKLADVDRVNLMRNLKEIQQIATVYLTVAMLKGLLMDDDDDLTPGLNLAINTLTKTGADLSFFISPNSASQVLDNLISVTSTLTDMQRAIGSIFDLIQGDVSYEAGPWRGQPKVAINTFRLMPGPSGGIKMWTAGSRVFDY